MPVRRRLTVGMLFVVHEPTLFMQNGEFVAHYKPELGDYRVSPRNIEFVTDLVAQGKAVVTGFDPVKPVPWLKTR